MALALALLCALWSACSVFVHPPAPGGPNHLAPGRAARLASGDESAAVVVERRLAVQAAVGTLLAGAGALELPNPVQAEEQAELAKLTPYVEKVKRLRQVISDSGELVQMMSTQKMGGALEGGGVDALKERVARGKKEGILPLLEELEKVAPTVATSLTKPEDKELATNTPAIIKGHLLELDEAVEKGLFGQYKSRKTGKLYPGGRVERELEEVEESVDDFVKLVGKR